MHKIPKDLQRILKSNPKTKKVWDDITVLARNEWICWIISPKKIETRNKHLERALVELSSGKRRPCCFAGCIHR